VGGVQTSTAFTAYISNTWTLSPYTGVWAPLATTLGPGVTYERLMRYSHAGAIIGDHLVIYGGGAYDETADRSACFSPSMFALNLVCRVWSEVQYAYTSARNPLWSAGPLGVLSHDLLARRNLLYVVGGTNGRASRALSVLEHDRCAWWATPQSCETQDGVSCEWLSGLGCREANRIGQDHLGALQTTNATTLPPPPASCGAPCDQFTTADACDRNWASYGCVWCAANSTCLDAAAAPDGSVPADVVSACARDEACFAGKPRWRWRQTGHCARLTNKQWTILRFLPAVGDRSAWSNTMITPDTCPDCLDTPSQACQWCTDVQACLPVNGTATCEPATEAEVCMDTCQGHQDCASCTANGACGWCSGRSADRVGRGKNCNALAI